MALEPLSPIEAMLNRHIAGSSRARKIPYPIDRQAGF
jgi:hypothetical protein